MKRPFLAIIVIVIYLLHQDLWFWRTATPLVFGFLPVGTFYHACYTIAVSVVMWLLVKHAWPTHLEKSTASQENNPQSANRNPQSGGRV